MISLWQIAFWYGYECIGTIPDHVKMLIEDAAWRLRITYDAAVFDVREEYEYIQGGGYL